MHTLFLCAGFGPSVTVAVNRGRPASVLEAASHKTKKLLVSGAYMHWYTRYGCDEDMVKEHVEQADALVQAYKDLLK